MKKGDIPGQQELKSVFTQMVDHNRLPHAMLIHGLEGGTSLALAYFLVSYLFCEAKNGQEPCGTCANCKRIEGLQHPDVHYIFPINKTSTIKKDDLQHSGAFVEEWRSMHENGPYFTMQDWHTHLDIENKQSFIGNLESTKLRERLSLRAYEGGFKVFIVWGADRMNPTFANKLLKNLEEPSDRTVFILVTDQPNKLLTTIISRVQRYQEAYISDQELTQFIEVNYGLSFQDAQNLAFRAEGSVTEAIKDMHQVNQAWLNNFKTWMRLAYQRDMIGLFNWSMEMARAPRESGRQFIKGALKVLDRCFRMGWIHTDIPMEGEEAAFYKNFSPFINSSNIEGFMDLLQETSFHIERNVNEKIVWYDTSIKAVRLIHEGKKNAVQA